MEKESLKSEIQKIPIEKRQLILDWAVEIKEIQNNKLLTTKQKIQRLKVVNNSEVFKTIFSFVIKLLSSKCKNATLPMRLAFIGGSSGMILAGTSGAGIAALGGAIGLPFFLVTAAGGAFIGTIIDTLKQKK